MLINYAKSLFRRIVSPTIDALGLYDRQLRRIDSSNWLIVMYHRVIADARLDPFSLGMCVSQAHFDEQIGYLRREFSPIGMSQAISLLEQGRPLPDRAVSVTLDDGYLDNLEHALPVLERHGVPATLFMPTGGMDSAVPLWWDRVIHALASTRKSSVEASLIGLPKTARLSLAPWPRTESVEKILATLWKQPLTQTLAMVDALEADLLPTGNKPSGALRLNSNQVLEMHRRGIEIGAHTVRHPNLTLEPPARVRWEMETSKRELESLCATTVNGFAYPAGWMNDETISQAREAGFRYAVATTSGFSTPQRDLFKLSRVGMPDTATADFKRALLAIARRSGAWPASNTALATAR
jgi:peptidoglycan/xylan/chitin deacetylase (PgdA/CDA1 family)